MSDPETEHNNSGPALILIGFVMLEIVAFSIAWQCGVGLCGVCFIWIGFKALT